MRKNITNTKVTTVKKAICMAAMMTAMLSLTACGSKESNKDKLDSQIKDEINNIIEDVSKDMADNTDDTSKENTTEETTTEQKEAGPYEFKDGVLKINTPKGLQSFKMVGGCDVNKNDVVEVIIDGSVINVDGFKRCDNLKKVTMLEGIKVIRADAFSNCPNLETVIIPNTVQTIERSFIWNCKSLKSITIPASVTVISDKAFADFDETFIIYGEAGSYIETYAKNHGLTFIAQ
ncbi:MAG: leucine-rich repeat domain-containing protein [Lachnospiraceae bacterium]|nr:leucine-rich repeat domain-containing protein [Lachnospiraceae bacterium]